MFSAYSRGTYGYQVCQTNFNLSLTYFIAALETSFPVVCPVMEPMLAGSSVHTKFYQHL